MNKTQKNVCQTLKRFHIEDTASKILKFVQMKIKMYVKMELMKIHWSFCYV